MPVSHKLEKVLADIVAIMAADSAISALVGTRIYGESSPQGATLPLIVWHDISLTRDYAHDSAADSAPGPASLILQFDIESTSVRQNKLIRSALSALWSGYSGDGTLTNLQAVFETGGGGLRESYQAGDGTTEIFRDTADFEFNWTDKP